MTKQLLQDVLAVLERGEVLCEVTAANMLRAALSDENLYTSPERVQKSGGSVQVPKPIPLDAIGALLNWAMDASIKNGADSRSMPDECVAVAHFMAFPEDHGVPDTEALRKELERVTLCLKKANDSTEEFERKWYLLGDELERVKGERDAMENALRSLASWLGVGGYNAPKVDAKVFEQKIRDGVEMLLARPQSLQTAVEKWVAEAGDASVKRGA